MLHSPRFLRPGYVAGPAEAIPERPLIFPNSPMRLTLLIPELLWSEPGDDTAYAAANASQLAKFLVKRRPGSRSDVFERAPSQGWEHLLLSLSGAQQSIARTRWMGDRTGTVLPDQTNPLLCADPVHLRFHQDRLILADANELGIRTEEMTHIAADLNAALAPARFEFPTPTSGYLTLPTAPIAPLLPLSQKIGCQIRPDDLGGDPWLRKLSNEIQMILHTHPVNQAREAKGLARINALWLWGHETAAGRLGAPSAHTLTTGNPSALMTGVAASLHAPYDPASGLPSKITEPTLCLDDRLLRPAQYQDVAGYRDAWQQLDTGVLSPVRSALLSGQLQQVDLWTTGAFGTLHWKWTPWFARMTALLPFASRSLSDWASELARSPLTTDTP